jgi:molybdate transport repressor ModE-like protein
MDSLDWNDLRYVVAVARQGSAAAAARVLGVSHATVLRRIQAIEQGLGSALFERLPTGYVVTEAGRTLTDAGEAIDTAIVDARRLIEGRTADLSGTLRFTTTDSLAYTVMPALLASFRQRCPAITVEMLVTNNVLDLDKRDADVTLRASVNPPDSWVGMRLVRMDFGAYASTAYLAAHPNTPWTDMDWLVPDGPLASSPSSRWLRSVIPPERMVLKVDSFMGLCALAQAGMGATVLPRFVAASAADLTLLAMAPPSASVDIWILTHADLKKSGRISAFVEHVAQGMRNDRARFEST